MSDSRTRIQLAATTAFVLIGCTWAFAIARYGGPDEPAHIIRAAAVSHGDLLGQPVAGLEPGYRRVTVPFPFASGDPSCYRHHETITAACAIVSDGPGTVELATSAGTAPPWYYAIVGFIARVLSSGRTVLGYRMAAVLLSAAVLGHALARSRRFGASAWLVAALTPAAWFLMGVVDTSGIEIALVVLALVEAVGRFRPAAAQSLSRVTLPLAACLLLRPAAVIDVAVVALFVLPTLPRPFTVRLWLKLLSPLAIAGLATLAWNRWIGLVFSDRRTADTNSTATALRTSIEGIPKMAHQAVGALGWNEFFAPLAAQLIWAATLGLAVWWVFTRGSGHWWHVAWALAALVLPTIVEVLVHRSIGAIWQGRYSIPFAIGGVFYAARWPTPPRALMRGVVFAAAFAEVVTLWWTLRRYMVGMEGSLTMQHASWQPPINPWLLLAVNATAIAWLCAVALTSGDDEFGSA